MPLHREKLPADPKNFLVPVGISYKEIINADGGFSREPENPFLFMAEKLCAGGPMLEAWFMATDYVSSPCTGRARIAYALILGVITWLYRMFGIYREGVFNAIMLGNCLAPLLDRWMRPRAFGMSELRRADPRDLHPSGAQGES